MTSHLITCSVQFHRSYSLCEYPLFPVDAHTDQDQSRNLVAQLSTGLQLQLQLANIMVRVH